MNWLGTVLGLRCIICENVGIVDLGAVARSLMRKCGSVGTEIVIKSVFEEHTEEPVPNWKATIMKHGGLTDGAGHLKMASDKLEEAWESARPVWDDIVSRTMDEEQIQPLLQQVRSTLDAVSRISVTLATACRECEDERGQ